MADQSERLELRGEVGALIGARDWSTTQLGPLETWPSSLKTLIGVMLGSRFPMMLGWGPDLLQFYNDAYVPVLGVKHPASLGAPVRVVWSEIWNVVGPLMHSVLAGGPALWREHELLFINSRGFAQETFHTFSQSPVPGDDGKVGGVLLTVQETTEQVQGERQLETLRALAERTGVATTATEACVLGASVLAGADADIPVSLVYLLGDDGTPTLCASSPASLAGRTDLRAPNGAWPFHEALRSREPVPVDDLVRHFGSLPGGRYGVSPERAVVVPLLRDERERYGFVVFGLAAWRAPTEGYLAFLALVASQLTSAIARARASEEERRRAEAMAELDRAKTLFFSNISHELRTPLTLMLGPTTDALRSAARILEGSDLEIVHRNALRLQKLVASLLDFARIEAGRARVSLEAVRLDALTGELAHAFDSVMREAGLAYEVSCEPLPHPLLIDPDMWEKILLNLISNALKFTFEGKVRVSLAARGGEVCLEVADTGIGIPAHEVPHIFDRFHRVAGARARTQDGSGIGLALVHELARLLGGDVTAKSAVDGGTTMTVVIPARMADASSDAPVAAPAATRAADNRFIEEARRWRPNADATSTSTAATSRAPPLRAPPSIDGAELAARVLVVDDNADMREYLARMLAPHWTVEVAVDGEAALTSIRARRPDVVLTDVMMPNLDGFGLVARLRADEATADLPVIVLSARAGEESRIEGLQVGADDYLVKPFSARELIARVRVHVSLAQLRRGLLGRAEEARRAAEDATRAKDEFLAMLGHELRNPLSPIVLAVELMHRRGVKSKELSVIERQLKQLMRLVDDLLDVSRITRGKVELHKERTSIAEVVKRAAESTQPLFQERQQALALDVPGDLFVDADPTRLQQVFANLLTNASKYSDPGTGVGVSANPVGDRAEIRVRDHGIGIRPEMRERVFDLFVQQPQALDRAAGGLGLGLAIVKNLVASHGGSVRVESAGPGTGSEFIVNLPSMPAVGGDARPAATGAATGAPRGSSVCRVLVVDDSADGAGMLADSLASMGHEVRVAYDGQAALDEAAVFHPDVAVLDIGLPEMSGYELAAHLRELPGGHAIRFVAATGYGRSRDRVTSMAAGFVDHLVKPVNLDRLREIVAQAATAKATH